MASTTFDEPYVIEIDLRNGSRYTVQNIYAMDISEKEVTCYQRGSWISECQGYNLIDVARAASEEGIAVYCVPQSQWNKGSV